MKPRKQEEKLVEGGAWGQRVGMKSEEEGRWAGSTSFHPVSQTVWISSPISLLFRLQNKLFVNFILNWIKFNADKRLTVSFGAVKMNRMSCLESRDRAIWAMCVCGLVGVCYKAAIQHTKWNILNWKPWPYRNLLTRRAEIAVTESTKIKAKSLLRGTEEHVRDLWEPLGRTRGVWLAMPHRRGWSRVGDKVRKRTGRGCCRGNAKTRAFRVIWTRK